MSFSMALTTETGRAYSALTQNRTQAWGQSSVTCVSSVILISESDDLLIVMARQSQLEIHFVGSYVGVWPVVCCCAC